METIQKERETVSISQERGMFEEQNSVYTLGRFQPYANHHHAAIDYLTQAFEEDVDRVYVGILRTPQDSRSPSNPFTDEEVREMIEKGYQEDYADSSYEVETFVFGGNPLNHRREIESVVGEDTTFLTREERWKKTGDILEMLEAVMPFKNRDIDSVHFPRDHSYVERIAEENGYEVTSTATEIRELIAEEDDEWRRYVSSSIEDVMDEEFEEAKEVLHEEGRGSQFDKFQVRDRVNEYIGQLAGGLSLPYVHPGSPDSENRAESYSGD